MASCQCNMFERLGYCWHTDARRVLDLSTPADYRAPVTDSFDTLTVTAGKAAVERRRRGFLRLCAERQGATDETPSMAAYEPSSGHPAS